LIADRLAPAALSRGDEQAIRTDQARIPFKTQAEKNLKQSSTFWNDGCPFVL
jgi:hypothetical protein